MRVVSCFIFDIILQLQQRCQVNLITDKKVRVLFMNTYHCKSGAGSRLFSRSLQLLGMCKDKQRGNYERGCFDIMSISLNRLLRFDAKVRVCVKKLRKKLYASWILLYFGHAARGSGKKNIIFEFLCFDLDLVLVQLRKQKIEKLKAVKKELINGRKLR